MSSPVNIKSNIEGTIHRLLLRYSSVNKQILHLHHHVMNEIWTRNCLSDLIILRAGSYYVINVVFGSVLVRNFKFELGSMSNKRKL